MRYPGESGKIDLDNITPKYIEDIWKDWKETWIWEKIEGLSYGTYIVTEINKGNIIIFCYGSYHTNLDENRVATAWGINCTYIEIYSRGYLPTTSQVENTYRSELTGLYEI